MTDSNKILLHVLVFHEFDSTYPIFLQPTAVYCICNVHCCAEKQLFHFPIITNKIVTLSLTVYNLFTNIMSKSTFTKHKILEKLIA
jgi:hypothetical protein